MEQCHIKRENYRSYSVFFQGTFGLSQITSKAFVG
jgi:hypothetical protein